VKLIVGLGNPGRRYARTRHNVGFLVVERLAERHRIPLDQRAYDGRLGRGHVGAGSVVLLEPLTFMNASGDSVASACQGLGLEDVSRDLVLVYDDVDLPFGRLRVRPGGSSGGHRGVHDVIECLGRADFARLRFGVGRSEVETVDHVLRGFTKAEESGMARHLDRAVEALETVLREGVGQAMNRFNAPLAE
jgi:PTH1 family peptidyl-tRNA hydrolase